MGEFLKYFENNFYGIFCLLKVMKNNNVDKIVFFFIVVIYGEVENMFIFEIDRIEFINFYGESKLVVEKMFKWCVNVYGLKYIVLRYFNVVGVYLSGEIGEVYICEIYLILLIL